jgi:CheY-like chemotaxis protein
MARILVIEDVPAVALSVRIVLEGEGHVVMTAPDGIAGLAALAREDIDVVVTDIWMPGKGGTQVIEEGRRLAPRVRYLAITGGAPSGAISPMQLKVEDFGADRVLFKPFQRAELLEAVGALAQQPGNDR